MNSTIGWTTDSLVGKKFCESEYESFFWDPEHIKNCLGNNSSDKSTTCRE